MKTVLVIAYHFPPGGGPGVQRVLKHVTYLRDAGWRPVVMTVADGDFPARDESLLKKIPTDIRVERVPIMEPYTLYRKFLGKKGAAIDVNVNKSSSQRSGWKEHIAELIRATLFIPDARVGWLLTAVKSAVQLVREESVDAIYTSSPPYTCALIGRAVKRKTGLPWVAGFRDPWTNFLTTPERWFIPAAIDRSFERSVFKNADAVEVAWTGITDDAMGKYPELDRSKFHHVPNGYDSSDFPDVSYTTTDKFTVTYTGSMYGRRTPAAFLKALDLLHKNGEVQPGEVHLRFVGRFGDEVRDMLEASAFRDSIETIAYVPHAESIAHLMRSDALLLVVDDAKESAEIVPGKVYEYLGVGRPIIALAPSNSAIANLITETRSGASAEQADIQGIANIIRTYIRQWRNKQPIVEPDVQAVRSFERRESAKELGRILDTVTARKQR